MANNITGFTDASNALSTGIASPKSLLIIGASSFDTGETASTIPKNTIFSITGTLDATTKFGSLSKVPEMVRIAILNGVTNIKGMILGTVGATGKDYTTVALAYTAALAASLGDKSIKCIAIDSNDTTVLSVLSAHLDAAEAEDMFRYSAIAPDNIVDDTAITTFADTINNKRIFVPSCNFVNSSQAVVSGIYSGLGICCAIMVETADPALPMNGVEIKGFGGVDRILLSSQKAALGNAGVVAMYNNNGNPTIHRLVTSRTKDGEDQADVTWQEATTVFIADDVLESVLTELRAKYTRTKNVARILLAIRGTVQDVLQNKEKLEIIQNLDTSTISVIKDPTDIYGAIVDYVFQVVTPLYTISIRQHMKI